MKGFAKFLLAIVLIIIGFLIMVGSFATLPFTNPVSSAPLWIIVVIGFVCLLGGLYMLRHR